ncbi:hypothetical protein L3Y34_011299 [Caenorhabditis briggsae]|uniref:Protein kinase domain-containing protein n=1 Tax=Caenorhabditis briggsae TaxID=6238 RepID=A0AAE8ZPL2_CAEBR|nr:hypothetical protein L3Y34_011299 [Caenorhabditis briggsae]
MTCCGNNMKRNQPSSSQPIPEKRKNFSAVENDEKEAPSELKNEEGAETFQGPSSRNEQNQMTEDSSTPYEYEPAHVDKTSLPKVLQVLNGPEFRVKGVFGDGVYGIVLRVKHNNGNYFAAKLFKNRAVRYDTHNEEEAFKMIRDNPHDNLLSLTYLGWLQNPPSFCTARVLMTQACGPSLSDVMTKVKREQPGCEFAVYSLPNIREIGKQIAAGMEHLEKLKIYHLDLKSSNVVFTESFAYRTELEADRAVIDMSHTDVKVIDYGVAQFHSSSGSRSSFQLAQAPEMRAPELFLGLPYNTKSDVWSMGCMTLKVYSGRTPFPIQTTQQNQFELLMSTLQKTVPENMLEESKREGKCLLNLSFLQTIVNDNEQGLHKWVREESHRTLFNLLDLMFTVDPSNRPSFGDIKKHEFFLNK